MSNFNVWIRISADSYLSPIFEYKGEKFSVDLRKAIVILGVDFSEHHALENFYLFARFYIILKPSAKV